MKSKRLSWMVGGGMAAALVTLAIGVGGLARAHAEPDTAGPAGDRLSVRRLRLAEPRPAQVVAPVAGPALRVREALVPARARRHVAERPVA